MTLEQWRFGNPLDILISSESRSCKGCQHAAVAFDRQYCGKGKKYGRQCAQYAIEDQGEKTMPQVQRIAIVETLHTQSPYSMLLAIWAQWMRLADHQHSMGDANLQDTKDFMRTAEAVNTMIDDLPRYQWWAIRKSRGICTVWRFPDVRVEDALQKAEDILTPKLRNHIATRRYFG